MLTESQIRIIVDSMKPFGPKKIGVFGSVARKEDTEDSDIDILYEFHNTIGLFKLIGLQQELERKLNKKIDLVSEKYLHPRLKSKILNDVKLIYGN